MDERDQRDPEQADQGQPGQDGARGAEPPDRVPIFGSWRRIYVAVLVNALLVMALIAAFSAVRW